MTVVVRLLRERHGFDHRFAANDNGECHAARDVCRGERWTFADHRTMAEVIAEGGGR